MSTVVMKFGGASVASAASFGKIAEIIQARLHYYSHVAIVISAMGNTTDQLIQLAQSVHPHPPEREYDMLVSVGERISIALLAMALARIDVAAVSFTGSQSGIITCGRHSQARIIEVRPQRLWQAFAQKQVAIVAGFQGVSQQGEITTLGRGGSDTSATALGIALRAKQVEFFKDVAGIFPEDPKICPNQTPYSHLTYSQAAQIVHRGAKILHPRCIALAEKNCLPLAMYSFENDPSASYTTLVGTPNSNLTERAHYESPTD